MSVGGVAIEDVDAVGGCALSVWGAGAGAAWELAWVWRTVLGIMGVGGGLGWAVESHKTCMNDPARKIFLRNENGDPETKNWTGD